ncbi:hypothetical protein M5X11_32420 [Paenibacillus alginolyticus]|uniref:hypothetical protein n=1 Tax=Paenibacillus alginolyticus TaxID=59839 RepID=UPI0004188565|nr:hypothetical protein [Paenibacillus alginolyticus]MCY9669574.1 hypothetical protein [Paenibacillus alginolyticus]
MSDGKEIERTKYFIERFLQMLRSNGDIEFNSFPICGLLELSRQFVSMPPGVRELSSEYIKGSIIQIIEHSSLLFKSSNQIPIKEMKSLFTALTLVKELKTTSYIPNLYEVLSNYNCYIGLIKTLQYVLNKGISGTSKEVDEYVLIDELICLIIEYLEHRGNTIAEVYAICNNWFRQDHDNPNEVLKKIIGHLKEISNPNNNKLATVRCSIAVDTTSVNLKNINSFIRKIISLYEEKNRVTNVRTRKSDNKITIYFNLSKLDGLYVDKVLTDIFEKLRTFKERTKENIQFAIKKGGKDFQLNAKKVVENIGIKHFDNLWKTTDYIDVNGYVFDEMFRLNEWIQILNRSHDRRTSFLVLWSIMEFMMVHSVHDNKIDSVCRNFIPYMGLFYFRKISKTFFKRLISMHSEDNKRSSKIITEHISSKLISSGIDIKHMTVADQSCILLFYKQFKGKWWDGISFSFASSEFVNRQTSITYSLVENASKSLNQLENILNNDIKQMYRLRNMLSHSGVNDSKILDNTYVRLKYYVETIVNAISYTWLHDSKNPKTLIEINDFKRVDYNLYKSNLSSVLQITNSQGKPLELLKLMRFKGTMAIPPNRFSFLGKLENNID